MYSAYHRFIFNAVEYVTCHLLFASYYFLSSFYQNKVALSFYLCSAFFWAYVVTCHVKLNDSNISERYTTAQQISRAKISFYCVAICITWSAAQIKHSLGKQNNTKQTKKTPQKPKPPTFLEPDTLGHRHNNTLIRKATDSKFHSQTVTTTATLGEKNKKWCALYHCATILEKRDLSTPLSNTYINTYQSKDE